MVFNDRGAARFAGLPDECLVREEVFVKCRFGAHFVPPHPGVNHRRFWLQTVRVFEPSSDESASSCPTGHGPIDYDYRKHHLAAHRVVEANLRIEVLGRSLSPEVWPLSK
jgi:hypothetical protein